MRVRVMVLNTTFNKIAVISWQSIYSWTKQKYQEKTTELSQVTDKLYHITKLPIDLYSIPKSEIQAKESLGSSLVQKLILYRNAA